MKIIQLTPAQQQEAATLKAAVIAAEAPSKAARIAMREYLLGVVNGAGVTKATRLQLSDDDNAVIVQ
jgi:hypothetical protein